MDLLRSQNMLQQLCLLWESAAVLRTQEAVTLWIDSGKEGLTRYIKKTFELEVFDKRYSPSINSNSITLDGHHLHFPDSLLLKGVC